MTPEPSPPTVQRQTALGIGDRLTVQRRPGRAPADGCSPDQTLKLEPATTRAIHYLQDADRKLAALSQSTASSMRAHFGNNDAPTVRYVQNIIRITADHLSPNPNSPRRVCHGPDDVNCGKVIAYVNSDTNVMVFCPQAFTGSERQMVGTLIHELAHTAVRKGEPLFITDRAYQFERLYGHLSPGEALSNADSYAALVLELASGAPTYQGAPPTDTYDDCPRNWRDALIPAIARAQRWNRDAQQVVADRRPSRLQQWSNDARMFLGGQSPAQLAAAQDAYDEAELKLRDKVDFQCETGGGGRCKKSSSYWYAMGDFHICPSLFTMPSDEYRAQELLAGLYGYYRITDNDRRSDNLAKLARALHYHFYRHPTAAEVSEGLTGKKVPNPSPRQHRPPEHLGEWQSSETVEI